MLEDLLKALKEAKTPKEKERIYKALERLGTDRMTANFILRTLK